MTWNGDGIFYKFNIVPVAALNDGFRASSLLNNPGFVNIPGIDSPAVSSRSSVIGYVKINIFTASELVRRRNFNTRIARWVRAYLGFLVLLPFGE